VVVGPDEVERGQAQVKNLESGEQEAVSREKLPEYLKAKIRGPDLDSR